MKDLNGQVAIVTGSATGLGAAVALKLGERGAKIVVNYTKSLKEAEATLAQAKQKDVEAILLQGDVGNDADCRRIVKDTITKWGRVDILVNNAGTTKFADHADLEALTADDFLNIYKVNVVGAYQMIRACRPHMKAQGYGAVVNVSSIAGVTGIGSSVAYAASKGALNTMTKCSRARLRRRSASTQSVPASSARAGSPNVSATRLTRRSSSMRSNRRR